jgi:cyclopropane-fatty-acyl-phospholipid synthase
MAELSLESACPVAASQPDTGWLTRRLARLLLSRIKIGRLTIVTPSGYRLSHAGTAPGPEGVLVLRRWRTLRRLLLLGDVSFAEAYMDGDWYSPDLTALIELAARNAPTLNRTIEGNLASRLRNHLLHRLNANTKRGSRRNITHHYDLGNDFYAAWLDAGMSYSSAIYRDPAQTLEEAQEAKQDRILELLHLSGGEHVLEIGCGWGGLAERLIARAGCHVTGLTLSPAQLAYARQRMDATGLAQQADLRLQDYRDVAGRFDRIVSIEMLEAVGEAWWPHYFRILRDHLNTGGLAVLQVITISEDRFESYRGCVDFIQRYIFPGGMLPTPTVIRSQAARAGLTLRSVETFGASYARTLSEWRHRFYNSWSRIERQGFDGRFKLMWDYYLAYCEGGFRAGQIDVGLYVLARTDDATLT